MSIILAPDGKTPVSATAKTAIKIEILHIPANGGKPQKIPILMAEIDQGMPKSGVQNVLSNALSQIMRKLDQLGVFGKAKTVLHGKRIN